MRNRTVNINMCYWNYNLELYFIYLASENKYNVTKRNILWKLYKLSLLLMNEFSLFRSSNELPDRLMTVIYSPINWNDQLI